MSEIESVAKGLRKRKKCYRCGRKMRGIGDLCGFCYDELAHRKQWAIP